MRRPPVPLAAVLAVATLSPPALGYTEPILTSYTRTTPNKAFVFVMLHGPRAGEKDPVRDKYPTSGLYRSDDPGKPVWAYIDGYVREAYPASDGVHLVVQHLHVVTLTERTCGNSPPEPPANPTVLTVYAGGKKVRDVKLGDLLDHVRFCRDHGPGWHPWLRSAHLDDAAGTFVVEPVTGPTRHIALSTGHSDADSAEGSELDHPAGRRWGLALGVGLLLLVVAGATTVGVVLFRSRPEPLPPPEMPRSR